MRVNTVNKKRCNMSEQWVKETIELIEDAERKRDSIQQKRMELEEEQSNLDKSILAWHELITAYMEKHNVAPLISKEMRADNLASKSYPEMLITIAQERQGYLRVADAVDILLKANVGRDKLTIQNNIYSALNRMGEHFTRIARGQYRYTNHIKGKVTKEWSGIRQAIKDLKDKNPQMTRDEVLKHLLSTGFDFKGKRPMNAVNMSWAKLGYAKEGKQQAFPIGKVGL
jgi:hypothetical protein